MEVRTIAKRDSGHGFVDLGRDRPSGERDAGRRLPKVIRTNSPAPENRMSNASSRFSFAALAIIAAAAAPWPASAQQAAKGAPARPYTVIAVTLPKPYVDAGLEAFRRQLGSIAVRHDRAGLARVVASDFFWMVDETDKANRRESGIDSLAAAIDLDAADGSGWETLAEAVGETSFATLPDRKGVVCAPAAPVFDEDALEELVKSTGTELRDWGYPDKPGVEVRASAQPNAPVIDRLGMYLVRVLPEPSPSHVRVVTPSGKTGFVDADDMTMVGNDQICYRKDGGGWKIAGYVTDE
jgi:hypothetical protein